MTEEPGPGLLAFVRGERRWHEIGVPGMSVDFDRWSLYEAPVGASTPTRVTLADVAQGFQGHLGEPEELRRWAFVILNASNSIELDDAFETTDDGEILLEALWDAAFGRPINPAARRTIQNSGIRQV